MFHEKSENNRAKADGVLHEVRGAIRFEVCFSYGPDRPILKDVSFAVPSGHTVGIVGASGSGKSSIIRLLFRLYEPMPDGFSSTVLRSKSYLSRS